MSDRAASDVIQARPASGLPRIAWIAVVGALIVTEISDAAQRSNVPDRATWWVLPVAWALVQALTLYVALRLAHSHPLGRRQPIRNLRVHAVAAVAYVAADYTVHQWLAPALSPAARVTSPGTALLQGITAFLLWTGVAHGVEYLRRYRASQAAALRLRTELADVARRRAEAELRSLKAELNPHLLGNALGTVSSQIETDPSSALRTLAELGDMMRAAIARPTTREVTLGEEIEGLESFLAVQRSRFDGGLAFEWRVDDAVLDATVPQMILHVLLEYAINRHVANGADATVRVSAVRAGGRALRLEIAVSGAQVASSRPGPEEESTLARVRERLTAIYAGHASLELEPATNSGVIARLTLPLLDEDREDGGSRVDLSTRKKRIPWLPVLLTAWFALLFAILVQRALHDVLPNGQPFPVRGAVASALLAAVVATAALYLAIRITRAERRAAWRTHAIAGLSIGMASALGKVILAATLGDAYPPVAPNRLVATVIVIGSVYGVLAAIVYAVEYARRYQGSEATGLRLTSELAVAARRRAEAQLRALKAELNPHFLGNALGAVSSLVSTDAPAARRVLAQLGDTLRAAVARVDTQEVTLREEIDGLAPFLAVEHARFGDRLAISWDVEDAALDTHVPHMILQPLLENAVKHGLSARGGRIVVAGKRAGDRLELSVRDNGVGLRGKASAPTASVGGVGLANARARLQELYGHEATFDLVPAPDVGTIARVTLPWR